MRVLNGVTDKYKIAQTEKALEKSHKLYKFYLLKENQKFQPFGNLNLSLSHAV